MNIFQEPEIILDTGDIKGSKNKEGSYPQGILREVRGKI